MVDAVAVIIQPMPKTGRRINGTHLMTVHALRLVPIESSLMLLITCFTEEEMALICKTSIMTKLGSLPLLNL
jgi:hypothetical protein